MPGADGGGVGASASGQKRAHEANTRDRRILDAAADGDEEALAVVAKEGLAMVDGVVERDETGGDASK